ncbi:hypothetical protein GCM10017783_03710 [Deinococcus piscis]|uniref:YqhA family protein n=1 Tax=Deinococcus piscis TaxID=394230 RepID=A0ABQ3JXW4_9DEIO|nr:YqhA family protein [Deinococcus piscis]GHF95076.1 hypothetical protein GCM10017783_03710 [Deinococcus piscis]
MQARPPTSSSGTPELTSPRGGSRFFGFTRLIVELGVLSSAAFSLSLFVAAIAQAYTAIRHALEHLGEEGTAKHLMIAAVEQADLLLVAMALLIISFGMQALFVGRVANVPAWLHIRSFDDLKQKLLGIVVVALAVNFFSVALEWKGGDEILVYGLALAAVMAAIGGYSVILSRQGVSEHP